MPPSQLTLSIDTFTVSLWLFTEYDRTTPEIGTTEYSLYGAAIVDGPLYEAKHLWTVKAFCTTDQKQQLAWIFKRSERKRRTLQDFSIRLYDYIRLFEEDSASNSRAIAPGGVLVADSVGCVYPAQFDVRIHEPSFVESKNGAYPWLVGFILRELEVVPAS